MPVEIDQIIRSKRKTLAIIVKRDGSVTVRAPMRATNKSIREFIAQHTAWIEQKKAELQTLVVPQTRQYLAGESILFLGEEYPLEVVKHQKQPLVLNGGFKLSEAASHRAKMVFERWYRQQAKKIIQDRVDFFVQQYGFQYQGLKITSARTRWGSCSARGALNFSWRLILAPLEQVDYVVVHELVHTIHHNHSQKFWKALEKVMPDFKTRKKWLKQHGQQLMV